ncbi:MAG: riboflavin synthase [Pseudomonadota bacterium]|nr:riboflavin synthase [Pseudomonadota bacterium]
MFTGLVATTAPVVSYHDGELCLRTDIPLRHGDSLAVDGCCLTVSECCGNGVALFQVSAETLARTHFINLQSGQVLNLERPMSLQDRLHGHFVTGHIDATARVTAITDDAQAGMRLRVSLPRQYRHLVWEKGYCTLQGVSLTINSVAQTDELALEFFLIPTTLQKTNLRALQPECLINVEYDMHAKYLHNLYQNRAHDNDRLGADL